MPAVVHKREHLRHQAALPEWRAAESREALIEAASDQNMIEDKQLQRLLLLQVRDGAAPPELANFPAPQQVFNAAILIREGYAVGQVTQDATGKVVAAKMTELTDKGYDFVE